MLAVKKINKKKKASRCSSAPRGAQQKPSEGLTACPSGANYGHSFFP